MKTAPMNADIIVERCHEPEIAVFVMAISKASAYNAISGKNALNEYVLVV
jgi:hypothetical protein